VSWPEVALGELCDFENGDRGKNYPSKSALLDSGIPFINAGHLKNHTIELGGMNYISEERYDLLRSGKVKLGDFLFCLRGSLGKFGVVERLEKGAIASSLVIIRPQANLHAPYLKHYFASDLCSRWIDAESNGLAQPNLGAKNLKKFKIPLPPLEEQKRIATILDQADAIVKKRQAALDKLNTLGQSIFYDMFGDRKKFEQIALGKITSKIGSGATPKGGRDAYKDTGIPLIRSMNIHDARFKVEGLAYIDDEQAKGLNNVTLEKDDVLINITGASVARVCRLPDIYVGGRVNQHVSIIRPTNCLNSVFLEFFLLSQNTKNKLLNIAEGGATRQAITKTQLSELTVPLPDYPEQERFAQLVDNSIQIKNGSENKLEQSKVLFASLQQRAFRGEL